MVEIYHFEVVDLWIKAMLRFVCYFLNLMNFIIIKFFYFELKLKNLNVNAFYYLTKMSLIWTQLIDWLHFYYYFLPLFSSQFCCLFEKDQRLQEFGMRLQINFMQNFNFRHHCSVSLSEMMHYCFILKIPINVNLKIALHLLKTNYHLMMMISHHFVIILHFLLWFGQYSFQDLNCHLYQQDYFNCYSPISFVPAKLYQVVYHKDLQKMVQLKNFKHFLFQEFNLSKELVFIQIQHLCQLGKQFKVFTG